MQVAMFGDITTTYITKYMPCSSSHRNSGLVVILGLDIRLVSAGCDERGRRLWAKYVLNPVQQTLHNTFIQ